MSNADEQNKNSHLYTSFDFIGAQAFSFPSLNYTDQNYSNTFMHNHHHHQQQQPPLQNPNHEVFSFTNYSFQGAVDQHITLPSSAFDSTILHQTPSYNSDAKEAAAGTSGSTAAEMINNPQTPISVSSSEAGVEEDSSKTEKIDHGDQLQDGNKHQDVTGKRRVEKKKKKREERFAFVTKSEVDNLEDGYRWRKYGQKALKNSPFPRSYYRCTTQTCIVKKRIERSYEDPSVVVTTYEGQHNHHDRGSSATAAFLGPSSLLMRAQTFPTNNFPHQDLFFPDPFSSFRP